MQASSRWCCRGRAGRGRRAAGLGPSMRDVRQVRVASARFVPLPRAAVSAIHRLGSARGGTTSSWAEPSGLRRCSSHGEAPPVRKRSAERARAPGMLRHALARGLLHQPWCPGGARNGTSRCVAVAASKRAVPSATLASGHTSDRANGRTAPVLLNSDRNRVWTCPWEVLLVAFAAADARAGTPRACAGAASRPRCPILQSPVLRRPLWLCARGARHSTLPWHWCPGGPAPPVRCRKGPLSAVSPQESGLADRRRAILVTPSLLGTC